MKNFTEGVFISQAEEGAKNIRAINARMAAERRETGVHEISQEEIDEVEEWSDERLELFAEAIADEQERRRNKKSN